MLALVHIPSYLPDDYCDSIIATSFQRREKRKRDEIKSRVKWVFPFYEKNKAFQQQQCLVASSINPWRRGIRLRWPVVANFNSCPSENFAFFPPIGLLRRSVLDKDHISKPLLDTGEATWLDPDNRMSGSDLVSSMRKWKEWVFLPSLFVLSLPPALS